MDADVIKVVAGAAVGTLGGGGLTVWFSKFMFRRLINENDAKHTKQAEKLEKISEKFTENIHQLDLKLARMEPIILSAGLMREDIKKVEARCAVHDKITETHSKNLQDIGGRVKTLTGEVALLKNAKG